MLIRRTYQLVDASVRYNIDLWDYRHAITRAAELSFREIFYAINVQSSYFTLTLDSAPQGKTWLVSEFWQYHSKTSARTLC